MKRKTSFRLIVAYTISVIFQYTIFSTIFGFFVVFLMDHGLISANNRFGGLFLISLFVIISGTIFAHGFANRVIKRVVEISEATQKVSQGHFDIKLKEHHPSIEIEELAKNFNKMAVALSRNEKLKDDFITNVSHEIKTPLTTIQGYASLIQSQDISVEKRNQYIQKIITNTRKLSNLTDTILMLSKFDNDVIAIETKKYRLDEQLRQVLVASELDWSLKNLQLDLQLETLDYEGSEDLLYQVWRNLIDNAIKFSHVGGDLIIRAYQKEGFVEVSVTDTGIGMSEAVLARVFERFYQADFSHSGFGNGLGMALSQKIVAMHGGVIEVSSKIDKGSTFTVLLPLS